MHILTLVECLILKRQVFNITLNVICSSDTSWQQCVEMFHKHQTAEGSQLLDPFLLQYFPPGSAAAASRRFASKHDSTHLYHTQQANASLLTECRGVLLSFGSSAGEIKVK